MQALIPRRFNSTRGARRPATYADDVEDPPPVCPNCRLFPVTDGYKYCSRECDSEARALTTAGPPPAARSGNPPPRRRGTINRSSYSNSATATSVALVPANRSGYCANCLVYEKVKGFDFCSKACLREYFDALETANPGGNFQVLLSGNLAAPRPPGKPCAIRGCRNDEAFQGAKYCGNKCRETAVTKNIEPACLLCKTYPKIGTTHFCGKKCSAVAERKAPMLLELPGKDPKHANIVNQFNASWQNAWAGNPPTIQKIFKIVNSADVEKRFQKYRQTVETAGNFRKQGKSAGNELRRWHGTRRDCAIGDSANDLTPCASATCALCNIVKTSFDVAYVRRGSYGNGIYTSAFSSTSNGYSSSSGGRTQYKAMFLTRVVAGNVHIYGSNGVPGGGPPPPGHHAVSIDKQHTELIMFRNESICPSWLVLYK